MLRLSRFILEIHKVKSRLTIYIYTETGEVFLRRAVGVRREEPPSIPSKYYYSELRQSPEEFYKGLEVLGWDDVYEFLGDGVVLQIMAWRNPKANKLLSREARELMRALGQSLAGQILSWIIDGMIGGSSSGSRQEFIDPAWLRERQQHGREVLGRAAKPEYVVRIRLYGPDKKLLKDIADIISPRFTRQLRIYAPLIGGRVGKKDPRRISGPFGFLSSPDKELLWMAPEELKELLILPIQARWL